MRSEILIFGVVMIIGILAGAIFLPDIVGEGGVYNTIDNLIFDDGSLKDKPEEADKGITGKVTGENSGVSNGGDVPSGNLGGGCYELQFSYSIQNFVSLDSCEDYSLDICIEKKLNCYLEVYNFDDELGENFGIRMYVVSQGEGVEDAIDSDYLEKFIGSNSMEFFDFDFVISSFGIEGNANKELECLYVTETIPKREFC